MCQESVTCNCITLGSLHGVGTLNIKRSLAAGEPFLYLAMTHSFVVFLLAGKQHIAQ